MNFSHILASPLFSIFLLLLFILWRKFIITRKTVQNLPPGPWKLPIIGNLHQLIGALPHHRLKDLAKKYGSVMHLQFGEVRTVVVSSTETAKQVLKSHDVIFANKPFLIVADTIFYNGADIIFASCGDHWKQLRKICISELFNLKRVQMFKPIREEEVSNLIKSISSSAGSPINLSKTFSSLSSSIVERAAFGMRSKDQEAFIPIAEEVTEMLSGFNIADFFPSIKFLHVITGIQYKLNKIHKKVDLVLENIIRQHRDSRETDNESEDLVRSLLNIQEHGTSQLPLTTENMKAVVLDIFLAGIDTSATVMEWAMSELIRNPRVMKKAQAEVRQVLDGQTNVEETRIKDLHYLKLVIKETMRLHPPIPLIAPRENVEHCQINGYDIPPKTRVLVNVWALGRDPNYWIEPEKFYPERFIDSAIDYRGSNFEFLPFGGGRRTCPAILFGMANVELPLSQLLYYFNWELAGGKNYEDLDMIEKYCTAARRKNDLYLIPVPYK